MNLNTTVQLNLPHLLYSVADIQNTLAEYPQLDCFMFLQNFNAGSDGSPTLHLLSYAHGNTQGSTLGYNEVYYNASNPDALAPFGNFTVAVDAPFILAPNGISKAQIVELIGSGEALADALIFVPKISPENCIYYRVRPAQLVEGNYEFVVPEGHNDGDYGDDTNPSPPATIQSIRGFGN
ncbi:hypothetical protein [Mucilaginibacter lacusdianchii]|uniref:hypothetical protein n=1 Tax=Mucilaginibacter lacusdianchii TaxID=2684211 RepID=UPI00131B250F|nr:hypothetical protein [Mucilaginibacter sp. JXJ CY 39]